MAHPFAEVSVLWTQTSSQLTHGKPVLRLRCSLVPRFILFCKVRAAQIRQGKAQSAGNGPYPFQGLQRRIGVFGRLPSGKTTSGHLRCCAHLN